VRDNPTVIPHNKIYTKGKRKNPKQDNKTPITYIELNSIDNQILIKAPAKKVVSINANTPTPAKTKKSLQHSQIFIYEENKCIFSLPSS